MTNSDDTKDALEKDPTLRNVGDKIDDAKEDARKIFGERDDKSTGEPNGQDDPDEDLGGAAPVP